MRLFRKTAGFSLIELLLVLAIIGIISGIAIPSFLGQRKRARIIGDAQSNVKVLALVLETRKAETGIYGLGIEDKIYTWKKAADDGSGIAFLPQFVPQGNSQMNYSVTIPKAGLTYSITITDFTTNTKTEAKVLTADQTGAVKIDSNYIK